MWIKTACNFSQIFKRVFLETIEYPLNPNHSDLGFILGIGSGLFGFLTVFHKRRCKTYFRLVRNVSETDSEWLEIALIRLEWISIRYFCSGWSMALSFFYFSWKVNYLCPVWLLLHSSKYESESCNWKKTLDKSRDRLAFRKALLHCYIAWILMLTFID